MAVALLCIVSHLVTFPSLAQSLVGSVVLKAYDLYAVVSHLKWMQLLLSTVLK